MIKQIERHISDPAIENYPKINSVLLPKLGAILIAINEKNALTTPIIIVAYLADTELFPESKLIWLINLFE
jgi:hypothetical protein